MERFKEWKKYVLSKYGISITTRNAFKLFETLICFALCFFLLITILYLKIRMDSRADMIMGMRQAISIDNMINGTAVSGLISDGISYEIKNKNGTPYYYFDNVNRANEYTYRYFFGRYAVDRIDGETAFFVRQTYNIYLDGEQKKINFYVDMTDELAEAKRLISMLYLLYAIVIPIILYSYIKYSKRLMKPLKEMTEKATAMDINKIHDGYVETIEESNEFKQLGEAYNEMLGRLERTYENQKNFISNAAHELRTPIAVVRGYTDMLNRWGREDAAILEESINAIYKESVSMQELVDKLLILSRHDRNTMKLDKQRFSMDEVVEETVKETRMTVKNRKLECPVIMPVTVYGDRQALKQSLRIFIDNAIKYTNDGDTINVSCKNEAGDCVFIVSDTGIGMTERDMKNIFTRFYRSDDVRGKMIEGHGLGLSIAKLIIQSHAGTIKVRTQYGKGTQFMVILPKAKLRSTVQPKKEQTV